MAQLQIPLDKKIKAVYLLIVLHTMQIGVGIAGYPRLVYLEAGRDSWISIIIAAIVLHLTIACIVFILNTNKDTDLHGILTNWFGSFIGKSITVVFIVYFFFMFLSVMINYIEFVQVFIFPQMSPWFITAALLTLVLYAVIGGVRIAVGTSIVFFFGAIWMVGLLYKPITLIDIDGYLPMFESEPRAILEGAKVTSFTILGFELLWFLYPYIHDKSKVNRFSQLAMAFTIAMIFTVTMVSIGFFSRGQLEGKIWPALSMMKVISFPMFERFDILAVALWMIIILPNMILLAWMISISAKRVFGWKQKYFLYLLVLIAFICQYQFDNRYYVNMLTDYVGQVGLYLGFLFPFLLLPFAIFKRVKGKNKADAKN
ncbi:spore germination protein (amino acid permease) [Alkalibacillus filiformis]|uniref:Spore germination protein (Amino acid permease) n=1 Tax=Alkalibacillus filiformis TaxID=200990 RepID=A0ABU0DT45_9BACI|nr:GerAB/ArcD/ProY family transporter [Alkalibacillus filiformis]MDQ0351633.1 spore germination protein (amino acid permease) [Alkalibacillus filiformis]